MLPLVRDATICYGCREFRSVWTGVKRCWLPKKVPGTAKHVSFQFEPVFTLCFVTLGPWLCLWLPAKAEGGPGGRLRAGEGMRSVVLSVLPVGYHFRLPQPLRCASRQQLNTAQCFSTIASLAPQRHHASWRDPSL